MRRGSSHLLHLIGGVWLATGGCAHAEPPPPAAPARETPDDIAKSCERPGAIAACSSVAETLRKLVAGEHSDSWFGSQAFSVRSGGPHELPADVVRVARAVAWQRTVNEHFERLGALDRELADYDKKDLRSKLSAEGQTFFVDRTLRRSLAAEEAGYEFRRLLGKFVDSVDGIAVRAGGQPPLPLVVAHETPADIVNECEAAKHACRATVQQLKNVVAVEHPDDWFWEHAILLRTRRPDSPSDAIRAARAIAWEPTVTEHLNRVDALAEGTPRRALAIRDAGREFKRLLAELAARLEQIAA